MRGGVGCASVNLIGGDSMRRWLRKSLTLLALYAVALHVIVLGFVPLSAAEFAAVDPFSVICRTTGPAAAPGQTPPGTLQLLPSRAIDHCNLCTAAGPPALDDILAERLAPTRLLHVLQPDSTDARASLPAIPKLARGPPQTT